MTHSWRESLAARSPMLTAHAQAVVHGLLARYNDKGPRRTGAEVLAECTTAERRSIWALCFPAVAAEVERAWQELPVLLMTRRDGGSDGYGELFTWPPEAYAAQVHRFTWLRKLLLLTGPYPESNLPELLARADEMMTHLSRGSTARYDQVSGHCYDADAPAYLAIPILNGGGPEADACLDVLRAALTGIHPTARFGRLVMTALLCGERPDAWQFVDDQLVGAGLDEGFRSHLLTWRIGVHPGAWRHLLATILRERLWRFPSCRQFLDHAFGLAWKWDAEPGLAHWLEMAVRLHDSSAARLEALRDGPAAALFLALFALAVEDGPAALAQAAALLGDPLAERRLACAWFLSLCPGEHRGELLVRLIDDADPRVRALAVGVLNTHGTRFPREASLFPRLESTLTEWPELLPASPLPWPTITATRDDATELLIEALPTGEEERVRPWLGQLSKAARQRLVKRLNRFEQTPTQRALLFNFFSDPDCDIAEHAVKAARSQALTEGELTQIEDLLASKQPKRRLLLIDLILRQLPAMAADSARRLLAARKIPQRLAGLELLRRFAVRAELRSSAEKILRDLPMLENPSADENRALTELRALLSPAEPQTPPTTANAFGLVDPATLPKYPPPLDRGVILHSPLTVVLLQEMDALLTQYAEVEFTMLDYQGNPKRTTIAQDHVPYVRHNNPPEEDRIRFPLLHVWEEWWANRPPERRDADGFELERMTILVDLPDSMDRHPRWLEMLYGISAVPAFRHRTDLQNLLNWLQRFHRPAGWRSYLLNAAETAVARLKDEKQNWAANKWLGYAHNFLIYRSGFPGGQSVTAEEMERFWQTTHGEKPLGHCSLWDALKARALGVATEDEFIWHLLGGKDLTGYSAENQFSDFGMATSLFQIRRCPELQIPAIAATVTRCRNRVVELELKRGEESGQTSFAARAIQYLPGSEWLVRLIAALGSEPLRRSRNSQDSSRAAVFSRLIAICHASPGETPEEFAASIRAAGIPRERLIEIAVFAPQWAAFIAHALREPGLTDGVDWIHAHTKTAEWVWQSKTRELWAGELSRLTPLSADELLEGAVDVDWFHRAYAAVGAGLWEHLYAAAKYACSGAGHTRARLFADALLDQLSADELTARIRTKREQDAVRALGLVPLPAADGARRKELLRRYRVLAEFRHGSAKSKAMRRASEEIAVRIGLDNLARAAGHSDPERFAWAMETEAASDLAAGQLRAEAGDLSLTLEVTPAGKLELSTFRAGRLLKSLPAAAKKLPAVATLLARREEARDQVARMRPALEDMMVRGLALEARECRGLMRHPFVAPLLRRLVLAAETGPLGFPIEDGSGLIDAAGAALPWPAEATPLCIAHPGDLLPAERWHAWQQACFDRQITQPFKQVFRELYVVVESERGPQGQSLRYEGHVVQPHQALALLTKRSWVHHPEEGVHRVFHDADCVAWLDFTETFYRTIDVSSLRVSDVRFATKKGERIPIDAVPPRVFSEAMRDVDLVVSVAHAGGANPEASRSSVEMRAALLRETCRWMQLDQVKIVPPHARIAGQRGQYHVHLGSGNVFLPPGRMLHLQPVTAAHRLFLPFADEDPKAVEILSKVLLLAEDATIKDPGFLRQLEA